MKNMTKTPIHIFKIKKTIINVIALVYLFYLVIPK